MSKRYKPERLIIYTLLLLLIPAMSIYAGGSKKIQEQLDQCQSEVELLKEENTTLQNEKASLEQKVTSLNAENQELQRKLTELEAKIVEKEKEIEKLEAEAPEPMIVAKTIEEKIQEKEAEIVELKTEKEQLESNVRRINQELEQTRRQLEQTKQELSRVNRELTLNNQKLEESKREITSLNSRIRVLETEKGTLSREKESLTRTIQEITSEKEEVEQALMAYERIEKETKQLLDLAMERIKMVLKEEIEKGKVRVYRSSLGIVIDIVGEYMFDTGKVQINPGGKVILSKIATLLNGLEGYMIGVVGNADNKPIVTPSLKQRFPTNWELSVHRGAVVVRYLLEKGKLSPTRMVAMGLGEYYPIDDNTTVEGRGNNRRVDIVLFPVDVMAAVLVGAEVK